MKAKKQCSVIRPQFDWRNCRKSKRRLFALTIHVPIFGKVVEHVLNSIEKDTLHVFHPDDERVFEAQFNRKGEHLLNKRATLPVSIREWLCVGCQAIEMGSSRDPTCLAYYTANSGAILPQHSFSPPGPAAFTGKIVVTRGCLPKDESATEAAAFAFVIAHELVHVFDMMRFVVPAFMDWKQFWNKALQGGTRCDLAASNFEDKSCFVDDYGSHNERAMIEEFWPSNVDEWFRAFKGRSQRKRA